MNARTALLAHSLGALRRRGGKAVALAAGLALAVALLSAVLFLSDSLRLEADRATSALPELIVQKLLGGRPSLIASDDAAKIRDLASVGKVTPRVWGYVFVPALQGNVTVVGTSPDDASPPLDQTQGVLAQGKDLSPGAREMIMGEALAGFLGLQVGDELALPSADPHPRPLKLVGTFASSVDLYTNDVLLCDDADARALLGVPIGQATDLAVYVLNPAESHVLSHTIVTRIPEARIVERDLLTRVYALSYGRRSGLVLAAAVPALFALFVLAWDRASGLTPDERREIAILKAVGWSTADVLWGKMYEALLVGASGTAAGLGLAYIWVFVLGAPGLRAALVGWSVLYPQHPLTPAVDLTQLLAVSLAVLGPFVGLSVVPAWRAATVDPAQAMRG